MGFCRRCGEIVAGERCRCGGSPAAPIVAFKKALSDASAQDKWTKTYVACNRSPSPTRPGTVQSSVEALNRNTSNPPSPTKRFPRPLQSSTSNAPQLSSQVSQHIASTTSTLRPKSPLKQAITVPDPSSDIIPSLVDNTLSKVYGSVLQPKETLSSYSCALCSSRFPPDATIYPDPSRPNANNPRFLCRPCYEENGGSKGPCGACSRPVLTLKSEGGFVQAASKYWHKRCFDCAGCQKNIGDRPMVDLLGRPCCVDCFDNCLKRETPQKPKPSSSVAANGADSPKAETKPSNVGGLSKTPPGVKVARESSPTIEELEHRLGIARRESSPVLEELSQRLSSIGKDINHRYSTGSPSPSPLNKRTGGRPSYPLGESSSHSQPPSSRLQSPARRQSSPAPTAEAIQEMKQRLFAGASTPSSPPRSPAFPSVHIVSRIDRHASSTVSSSSISDLDSLYSPLPVTPDLISDFSDNTTQSSFSEPPDSPPRRPDDVELLMSSVTQRKTTASRYNRSDIFSPLDDPIIEETNSQLNTPVKTPTKNGATPSRTPVEISPLRLRKKSSTPLKRDPEPAAVPSACRKCGGKLFTVGNDSTFVTLSSAEQGKPSEVYHTRCFTCSICNGTFESEKKGQASFVRHNGKPCHAECAPKERITIHKSPSTPALRSYVTSLKREEDPPSPSPSRARSSTHRPTSSRFEPTALAAPTNPQPAPRFGSRTVCPGCKKAVSPMERGVIPGPQGTKWHSSCLVCGGKKTRPVSWYGTRKDEKNPTPGCGKKLDSAAKSDGEGGLASSPQPSPVRTVLSPTYTGSGKVVPQFTGTTTIARQFTGAGGGGEAALLRQLTGGGLNPTRSISPTKQLGSGGVRPRPKSVLGMRNTKSVDEGRGMFLHWLEP
ncbi:hypothetical protein CC1G_03636 [Coprinopsis cinerea okayama7|uniref:LIM zinc-binding domain-containing protein n=1 Tax=Coprinopsis cinerea (strain Okayama-7 / 130 / ATCC MYA-4618 / FGSC 9003) TaxID=240176 RepID=A8N1U3_COPC7|nr:hypothetical protein CC1G_03636 [Coprinopsis cinerea okayama7\|eukprot:XP_001828842.2 hypothetical protein CC1G_03636 [Coprinopsis cinerea okayama7\